MQQRLEPMEESPVLDVFRGFREGGLEFQAQIALPYRSEFQSIPMHGQFLLVQLETPDVGQDAAAATGQPDEPGAAGRVCSNEAIHMYEQPG